MPSALSRLTTRSVMYHPPPTHGNQYPPQPRSLYEPPAPVNPALNQSSYIPRTPAVDSSFPHGPSTSSPNSPFSPSTPQTTSSTGVPRPSLPRLPSRSFTQPPMSASYEGESQVSPDLSGPAIAEDGHITIHDFSPREGNAGTQITVKCDLNFPATPPASGAGPSSPDDSYSGRALRIVLGSHPVPTQVMNLEGRQQDRGQMLQLVATVPNWSSSMGRGNRVPVYVQALEGNHQVSETALAGDFSYHSTSQRSSMGYSNYAPGINNPLKRSGESLESERHSPQQYMHRRGLSAGSNFDPSEVHQYAQPPPANYHPSPNPGQDPHFSSPYMPPTSSIPSGPSMSNYSPTAQPNLMRATQIIQPSVPIAVNNSYSTPSTAKARLELNGDLNGMSKGWTQEEWMNRRRLVQFWRRQEGTTIHAAFRPLSQQDHASAQNSIIISCIFREDKNECFVTSVDAIYLLEALVGTRFTVEEKNRIRRNLEGFRPITVSKNKAGSEDFFKLIMGFPTPKPRNIEKDVKVFPWDILGSALQKIIGKYSASYPFPPSSSMGAPSGNPPPGFSGVGGSSMPMQDPYGGPPGVVSSGSAPPLVSHNSDSSNYGEAYPPGTSHSGHHGRPGDSPTHYRPMSSGHHSVSERYHHGSNGGEYVSYPQSPYPGQPGQPPYWGGSGGQDHHSMSGMGPYNVPGQGMYEQHPMSHVNESHSRQSASGDMRAMYPAIAQ